MSNEPSPAVNEDDQPQTPPVVMREVRYEVSRDFVPILAEAGVSLLVSTYQAGKLVVVGTDQGKLALSFHNFEQAMGLALSRETLAIGTRYQVWLLAREAGMAAQLDRGQAYDDCYLARRSHFTGQIHIHELAWGEAEGTGDRGQESGVMGQGSGDRGQGTEELWVVNTLFSCLATLDERHSFVPRWQPRFITGLAAEDRCHLNGLAMQEGRPKYVTAMSETDGPQSWRPTKVTSGCVIDVPSSETIARGLAMPHSPRLAGGRLWVLNSGLGNISYVEPTSGKIEAVEQVPGYTRGLAFHGPLAFVGMSRIRETSTFGGVPIAEKREELRCGVAVVDMRRGRAVAYIEFKSGVEEIFAVEVVPHARCPFISGPSPTDDDAAAVWMVPRMQGAGARSQGSEDRRQGTGDRGQGTAGGRTYSPLTTHHSPSSAAPRTAEDWNEHGGRLMEAGQYDAAAAAYRRAIETRPTLGAAWANLAFLTADRGQTEAGRQLYAEAYLHQPSPQLRIVQATVLPPIFRDAAHVHEARDQFSAEVAKLVADGVKMDPTRTTTPSYFFLAYQGYNDRDLMAQLASVAPSPRKPHERRKRGKKDRIRLGFLSQYLADHTIGQLNIGIIEQLDKRRFELIVLSTSKRDDEIVARIRQAADRYIELPHEIPAALDAVAAQQLDILHFPDIGMAPFTYGLAHSRLAPVQTMTWGHPVTSGLPAIDYFLSCKHGETDESDSHYTEKLVRLSRLNVCLSRPERKGPKRDRDYFRLPADAHVYACPQMLFKFHPDFDAALAGILRGDEKAIVVTLDAKYPEWKELLEDRWKRQMPDVADRIRFLPKMPRTDFMELLACSDVMLDPFPFGGGHTSYEALANGLPVITLPGQFLRGRLAHAMYQQMGDCDLLVDGVDAYVQLALRMGTDKQERERASQAILNSCGVLYDDRAIVRELEEFWQFAAERG
jgi:protein O-GlcNAc transferase